MNKLKKASKKTWTQKMVDLLNEIVDSSPPPPPGLAVGDYSDPRRSGIKGTRTNSGTNVLALAGRAEQVYAGYKLAKFNYKINALSAGIRSALNQNESVVVVFEMDNLDYYTAYTTGTQFMLDPSSQTITKIISKPVATDQSIKRINPGKPSQRVNTSRMTYVRAPHLLNQINHRHHARHNADASEDHNYKDGLQKAGLGGGVHA